MPLALLRRLAVPAACCVSPDYMGTVCHHTDSGQAQFYNMKGKIVEIPIKLTQKAQKCHRFG